MHKDLAAIACAPQRDQRVRLERPVIDRAILLDDVDIEERMEALPVERYGLGVGSRTAPAAFSAPVA